MNKSIEEKGYITKTEFVREAIRKKLEEDQREKLINEFMKFKGKAKKKTTYEENRKTREKFFLKWLEKKAGKFKLSLQVFYLLIFLF